MRKVGIGFLVAAVAAILLWTFVRPAPREDPTILPDTIHVPYVPKELLEENERLRSENASLWERLKGVEVIRPEQGKGPIVIYDEPVPLDTAVASLQIKRGALHTTLQVPGDSLEALLIQLPVKDIRRCSELSIGGNGMTRCKRAPLGILDAFAEGGVTSSAGFYDRTGLSWQRDPSSNLHLQVWTRPSELGNERPKVYIGAHYRFNLFGR